MIKKMVFEHPIVMVGFGAIGQGLLPVLFRHLEFQSSQLTIITKTKEGMDFAKACKVNFEIDPITRENYKFILEKHLNKGALLLNMAVDVSSLDLILLCHEKGALYVDLCIEPWRGMYTDSRLHPSMRTNYALREQAMELKKIVDPTVVITHGANPGLVSHFVKQALLNMAKDNEFAVTAPQTSLDWAKLAHGLGVKVIHIAERDTQIAPALYQPNGFLNTWSVEGFISESAQPAELGWGTHERHWPDKGARHEYGSQSAIYLERPGASVRVRTWTPSLGPFHGFLITHAESISISNYLTFHRGEQLLYKPTVHYDYLPCPQALVSLHQLAGNEWKSPSSLHVLLDEIVHGYDELGVLLMGNKKGAYWYGSTLDIHEARSLAPHNNATSLQVVAGAIAAIMWAIEHPNQGLVEPEDIDYEYVLDIARPYLGKLSGHYTDWTPLQNRGRLFEESVDPTDPWQFVNIKVK